MHERHQGLGSSAGGLDRRRFLTRSALLAAGAWIGDRGLRGAGQAATAQQPPATLEGKDPGIVVLSQNPLCAETPAHLLDDAVTPASRMFVRHNGVAPIGADPAKWTLQLAGEAVERSVGLSLAELRETFEVHTLQLQLECGGNGRSEFQPAASGNQWTTGAIGCPRWTGVRLRDVLARAGVRDDAVYVGYYGTDTHLNGDPRAVPISRGFPIEKAMQAETMLAWAMNDEPLATVHGGPLRLVAGGFPGSASGKWVSRLVVRDRIHDGPKMTGMSYKVPCKPVAPGSTVEPSDMCIIESMPVKSLITSPRSGLVQRPGRPLDVRGHAWAGERAVASMACSIDFGQTWSPCELDPPVNRLAWQHWRTRIDPPGPGYYEIWARATDDAGDAQPMVVPGWNPRGYLNNACHRIALRVRA
ncbi:MAG: sulfite oxidase [Acidobacteriota bacterium]|nr:sulfite oxidase [Acidobacteriota bacterium]